MSWFTLFDRSTGRPRSIASSLPDPLPAGIQVIDHGDVRPDLTATMWDPGTKGYVVRPPKVFVDRVDDLLTDARIAEAVGKLAPRDVTAVRDALGELLGRERFRPATSERVIR